MLGSFDRIGFRRHARGFVAADTEVDLGGRVCLVTGGNAGLGRATAHALALRGATVRLLCRDAGRAEAARDELRRQTGSSAVDFDLLDVSDLSSVDGFVARTPLPRVDALVHNAGLLPDERRLTAQGHELTFATHVLGPHRLTHRLLPALSASGDARVVFVSSGGMYTQRLSLEDLAWERRRYDGVTAYAQTKRMQVVLAAWWAAHLGGADGRGGRTSVYSMHPGWADTGGVRSSLPRFHMVTRAVLRSAEEGADTTVWLVTRRPAPPPGRFYFDRAPRDEYYLPFTRESPSVRERFLGLCHQAAGVPAA